MIRIGSILVLVAFAAGAPAQVRWLQQWTSGPSMRSHAAFGYDAGARRTVLFGGYLNDTRFDYYSDTWLLDGATWSHVPTMTGPTSRMGSATVYDAARQCMVLFGGYYGWILGISYDDTWIWKDNTWTRATPATKPPPRSRHGMVYDERAQKVVLFGGNATFNFYDDTWEWDGVQWTELLPSRRPPAGAAVPMAYDSSRGVTVLVSGTDTWELDQGQWFLKSPAHSPPNAGSASLVHDRSRGVCVLFTGLGGETWEYDGNDWQRRTTDTAPFARSGQALAYDAARGQVVLFGGRTPGGALADLWLYAPVHPARYLAFGSACAGSAGMPSLRAKGDSLPWLGQVFTCEVGPLPLGHAALLHVGESRTQWGGATLPFDLGSLGMPGCTWQVSGEVLVPLWSLSSMACGDLAVPNLTGLLGGSFYSQVLVLDAAANAFGAIASEAREAVIGGR